MSRPLISMSKLTFPFFDSVEDSDADYRTQFISSRGNEYFCEIDEDYLMDRFNLTGLNTEVQYYQYALDLVTDVFDLECEDDMREQIEKSARHLYGLVHARYIVTTRGLQKMVRLTRFILRYSLLTQKYSSTSSRNQNSASAHASSAAANPSFLQAKTTPQISPP